MAQKERHVFPPPGERSHCMEGIKIIVMLATRNSSPRDPTHPLACRCQGCQQSVAHIGTGWNIYSYREEKKQDQLQYWVLVPHGQQVSTCSWCRETIWSTHPSCAIVERGSFLPTGNRRNSGGGPHATKLLQSVWECLDVLGAIGEGMCWQIIICCGMNPGRESAHIYHPVLGPGLHIWSWAQKQ